MWENRDTNSEASSSVSSAVSRNTLSASALALTSLVFGGCSAPQRGMFVPVGGVVPVGQTIASANSIPAPAAPSLLNAHADVTSCISGLAREIARHEVTDSSGNRHLDAKKDGEALDPEVVQAFLYSRLLMRCNMTLALINRAIAIGVDDPQFTAAVAADAECFAALGKILNASTAAGAPTINLSQHAPKDLPLPILEQKLWEGVAIYDQYVQHLAAKPDATRYETEINTAQILIRLFKHDLGLLKGAVVSSEDVKARLEEDFAVLEWSKVRIATYVVNENLLPQQIRIRFSPAVGAIINDEEKLAESYATFSKIVRMMEPQPVADESALAQKTFFAWNMMRTIPTPAYLGAETIEIEQPTQPIVQLMAQVRNPMAAASQPQTK